MEGPGPASGVSWSSATPTWSRRRGRYSVDAWGGPELLACTDERGRWVDMRSSDINANLQDALGREFTAKDF